MNSIKAVCVISPFKESATRTRAEHGAFAQILCRKLARAGYAVFASHLFAPSFLDEDVPGDRDCGIRISQAWIERSDALFIWDVWGISTGMKEEIAHAERHNAEVLRFESLPMIAFHYASRGEIPEWSDLIVA
jgi:hypothetical protein